MADKPLKIALIGCGGYGLGAYAPALAALTKARAAAAVLAAACDTQLPRAQQAVEQYGFAAACADVAGMIRDHKPDLCVCALPRDETLMQGSQLLAQNMKCILEPPLGDSINEVMEIADAARETATAHAVNLSRRYSPLLVAAGRYLRQIGEFRAVECHLAHAGANDRDAALALIPHALDAVFSLAGACGSHAASLHEGAIAIDLKYPAGASERAARVGRVEIVGGADAPAERYALTGEGCRLEVVLQAPEGPALRAWRGAVQEIDIQGADKMPADGVDGLHGLLAQFLDALVAGSAPPTPTIDDSTAIIDIACQVADTLFKPAG